MNTPNRLLIIALVVIPICFGIFRGAAEMAACGGVIALAFFFENLDKFQRFKVPGVEAELKVAVDKAYAAIEQLKELALAISAPIVDELALSGQFMQYMPLKYKLQRVEKIAETLRKLGATEKETTDAISSMYQKLKSDHDRRIVHHLTEANPDKAASLASLKDELFEIKDREGVERLIAKHSLKKSSEADEAILDLDYYEKNKAVRREDKWQ